MPNRPLVTFLTDFGLDDTYVAQMKGAALSVCPDLVTVDITHAVPAHDVAAGAYLLRTAYAAFPHGTIHVAVVDPGVGTTRARIALRTEQFTFVGPDNGIFSRVLDETPMRDAYRIEASPYVRQAPSATFEGRDVFAPAAAWLARGIDIRDLGPRVESIERLPPPTGAPEAVRVLVVDRFGNVILDLRRDAVAEPERARLRVVTAGGGIVDRIRRTYADAADDSPFLLFNSADQLEIAVRRGRADRTLGLAVGDEVRILRSPGADPPADGVL